MKKIILTQEQIENILLDYNNNLSQQKIAEKYNISRSVVKRILEENKIAIRVKTQKYNGDYDIFQIIDTAEKAYWLGFLAADGCNYQRKTNASIIINIKSQDIEQLYKFKKFCKTNAEIKIYTTSEGYSNNTEMCKIILNSKKMSNDLIDKGIISNKSLILKPPRINEQYYLPFILGYFDGDGSISKTSQYNNYCISIQGTKEILEWINDILHISNKLEKRNSDDRNSYYIRCGGVDKPYNIMKQLYSSCEIKLNRKYEIFKTLETVVLNRNIE